MTDDDFFRHDWRRLELFTLQVIFNSSYLDYYWRWLKMTFSVCLNRAHVNKMNTNATDMDNNVLLYTWYQYIPWSKTCTNSNPHKSLWQNSPPPKKKTLHQSLTKPQVKVSGCKIYSARKKNARIKKSIEPSITLSLFRIQSFIKMSFHTLLYTACTNEHGSLPDLLNPFWPRHFIPSSAYLAFQLRKLCFLPKGYLTSSPSKLEFLRALVFWGGYHSCKRIFKTP